MNAVFFVILVAGVFIFFTVAGIVAVASGAMLAYIIRWLVNV